jgi:phosphatidylserine/phosphatidylglycerophosphate/cardiolipin synthase-like enzyme
MKTLSFVLFASLVTACATSADPEEGFDAEVDDARVPDFCNATDPRKIPVAIVADPEAGEAPFLEALASAQKSIRVEIYLMGYGGILDMLKAKAAEGLDVRVMLDQSKKDTNAKYFDQLVAAGVQAKWSDPKFTFQHSKFIVVDSHTAVLTTGNFSKSFSIDKERNFVATNRDRADIIDLKELFDADWVGREPKLGCTRLLVSPINARQRILDVIASAERTLEIESMQFADWGVRNAVKARVAARVSVRVMLADPSWIDANESAASFLHGLGVEVRTIPHLHTKAIVADGERAYVGSVNFSQTSLDKNREVGLVVVEPASIAPLQTTFELDWSRGEAL